MSHSDPTDSWDSSSVVSQASTKLNMDSSGQKDSAGFDADVLSQSDDDLMFDMKKVFSPVEDSFGETTAARRSVEVSDSPSPDLVQDAYDGDEFHVQSEEIKQKAIADAAVSFSYAPSDLFSNVNTISDDRPTSLPDILKSSPLNPDKVDSGSSEGSPDFSPVHRSGNDSPNSPFPVSAISPFGFDSKILLLKEMAEETEAKAAEKAKLEADKNSKQSFAVFDLVKETDMSTKNDTVSKYKDCEVSSQKFSQMADKFECLNFPSAKVQEHWDSESPSADSFSPVLDAVMQKPLSFSDQQVIREENEATDEVSEQEASSEEFEFVERPPRGATDEFLDMQESPTFTKPSEMLPNEEQMPKLEPEQPVPATEEAHYPSSYHLLAQTSGKSPNVTGRACLESDIRVISPAPLISPPVDETGAKKEAKDLCTVAVVELLYWRDVRASGLVFGSSFFLLFSLINCSIISVLSYFSLVLLSITISFRTYKGVLQAIQKSDEGHPFKQYLDRDVALSEDAVQKYSEVMLSHINRVLKELRRLFLVEDLIDSLKFAGFLWVLTYIGARFNGLTLLILGLVGAFSGPKIYEKHQAEIDQIISTITSQIKDVLGKIQEKVPGVKKKPE